LVNTGLENSKDSWRGRSPRVENSLIDLSRDIYDVRVPFICTDLGSILAYFVGIILKLGSAYLQPPQSSAVFDPGTSSVPSVWLGQALVSRNPFYMLYSLQTYQSLQ
jgi:hypothetical protein